jgi:serine/threonine protein phosphatase 1
MGDRMRTLVLGDVHGAYRALRQVFERAKFDYEKDELIFLGDLCDGFVDVKQCFDEFLKIKNLIFIMGNHDEWLLNWLRYGLTPKEWVSQGGSATIKSFGYTYNKEKYISLLLKSVYKYVDDKNRLFVHGGIPAYCRAGAKVNEVTKTELMWDRSLQELAHKMHQCRHADDGPLTIYDEIYVGHTSTELEVTAPQQWMNLWNLDQGAGWKGKLTLMDVDTKEYWQSDLVTHLYSPWGKYR